MTFTIHVHSSCFDADIMMLTGLGRLCRRLQSNRDRSSIGTGETKSWEFPPGRTGSVGTRHKHFEIHWNVIRADPKSLMKCYTCMLTTWAFRISFPRIFQQFSSRCRLRARPCGSFSCRTHVERPICFRHRVVLKTSMTSRSRLNLQPPWKEVSSDFRPNWVC